MKRFETVVSSTHLDSQGDRMTRDALESLVASISKSYIPVGIEHDPRIPPQGRIVSGFVRECADGEFEAVAIMEIFEEGDDPSLPEDTREVVLPAHRVDGLTVSYDWTHRSDEDKSDIKAIADVLRNEPVYEVKKSADPISIILMTGAFALGGIASGFLGQIGSDGWNLVKNKLGTLFARQRSGEQLLVFRVLTEVEGRKVEVEAILTNPSSRDIDDFLSQGLNTLDKVLPIYLADSTEVRRLVFEVQGSNVELKFAVRRDCRALAPSIRVKDILREKK